MTRIPRRELLEILIRHGLITHDKSGYHNTYADRYFTKQEIMATYKVSMSVASNRIRMMFDTINKGLDPLAENRGGYRQRAGRKRKVMK